MDSRIAMQLIPAVTNETWLPVSGSAESRWHHFTVQRWAVSGNTERVRVLYETRDEHGNVVPTSAEDWEDAKAKSVWHLLPDARVMFGQLVAPNEKEGT